MQQYTDKALSYASKSLAKDHRHGAVCVMGNKVICGGYNYPTDPHLIKVCQKVFQV